MRERAPRGALVNSVASVSSLERTRSAIRIGRRIARRGLRGRRGLLRRRGGRGSARRHRHQDRNLHHVLDHAITLVDLARKAASSTISTTEEPAAADRSAGRGTRRGSREDVAVETAEMLAAQSLLLRLADVDRVRDGTAGRAGVGVGVLAGLRAGIFDAVLIGVRAGVRIRIRLLQACICSILHRHSHTEDIFIALAYSRLCSRIH